MVQAVVLTLHKTVPRWLSLFRWGPLLLFCKRKRNKHKRFGDLMKHHKMVCNKEIRFFFLAKLKQISPMRRAFNQLSITAFIQQVSIFDWFCCILPYNCSFSPHARLIKIVYHGLLGVGLYWVLLTKTKKIDQFRYIKIQSNTIELSTRLWGINPTNSVDISQSLVLRSIVLGWILIYRNWSII